MFHFAALASNEKTKDLLALCSFAGSTVLIGAGDVAFEASAGLVCTTGGDKVNHGALGLVASLFEAEGANEKVGIGAGTEENDGAALTGAVVVVDGLVGQANAFDDGIGCGAVVALLFVLVLLLVGNAVGCSVKENVDGGGVDARALLGVEVGELDCCATEKSSFSGLLVDPPALK